MAARKPPKAAPAESGDPIEGGGAGGKTIVIVESPAKARTIGKYLGADYVVESSLGHIRDLPRGAEEIPEKVKKESWSRLGIDIANDFAPLYIVPQEKKAHVAKLRGLVKAAREVVLATDDDREGESIAWHLADELKPRVPVKRMVFHEITKDAIEAAIASPREIDDNLVQAQEARRALDRLYGYEVSPVLWKKVRPKLSAGRVQSVAIRMLVERERERMRFVVGSYWDVDATVGKDANATFSATLVELGGKRLAIGKDFDSTTGKLKSDSEAVLLDEKSATSLSASLAGKPLGVTSTEERPYTLRPYAPFITSTLQQEANRKLGFSAQRTMRAAQSLYESGFITYMRTDSTTLSAEALRAARRQVTELYGAEYLHGSERVYEKKVKNAQEAHEAIRPAGASFRTPDSVRGEMGEDAFKVYDLVWKRTVASQMADARGRRLQVRMNVEGSIDGRPQTATFTASGKTIDFAGFLRAYVEGSDDPEAALEDREVTLPPLAKGDSVPAQKYEPKGHTTQPPARYTEASLVQALEAAGIGRPSTYASIIQTIQNREYAHKRGQALVPTLTAFATVRLLESHFDRLVDYGFTARMEEDLDEIAAGTRQRTPYLREFYFGDHAGAGRTGEAKSADGGPGLKTLISERLEQIDARQMAIVEVPKLGNAPIEVRVGKFGPFIKRGDETASIPDEIAPDEITLELVERLLTQSSNEKELGKDPETGFAVLAKAGRYGPYIAVVDDDGKPVKGRTASLFPTDSLEAMTFERAMTLLSLPRRVGEIDGEEVLALNGRFGPYLKKGTSDTRSLANHDEIFSVTLDRAREIFAQPKLRRGQVAAPPLKTFEYADRAPIVLKQGRYGPYVSDGELTASLRREEEPSTLDAVKARDILAERGKPPKNKRGGARRGAPKPVGVANVVKAAASRKSKNSKAKAAPTDAAPDAAAAVKRASKAPPAKPAKKPKVATVAKPARKSVAPPPAET